MTKNSGADACCSKQEPDDNSEPASLDLCCSEDNSKPFTKNADVPSTGPNSKNDADNSFSRIVGLMDMAGVLASTLCMVHCLALPILVLLLPVLAKPLMEHDIVHIGLAGFVLAFCLMAFVPGYIRHRDLRLLYIGALGISLVFFATFVARYWGEIVEACVITAGNTIIIFGHFLNRKLLSKCCKH